jgi:hypothetical protein
VFVGRKERKAMQGRIKQCVIIKGIQKILSIEWEGERKEYMEEDD